jgi:hypothetical protein
MFLNKSATFGIKVQTGLKVQSRLRHQMEKILINTYYLMAFGMLPELLVTHLGIKFINPLKESIVR